MEKKHIFEPGDFVSTPSGHIGIVISDQELRVVQQKYKEGNRPGRYFAPGCCQRPDYVIQIPILFEDGTFDVMRAMNVKKRGDISEERQLYLMGLLKG